MSILQGNGGMLSGFRVLDLTDEGGFLAGKILGDLGADVIKIEAPGGDPARRSGPYLAGVEDPERSLKWLALNTSKRGVTLDLRAQRGRQLFQKMVSRTDVVLESSAPGVMDALGVGYLPLSAEHPRLVWCALTPFGQSGPYASYRAHDLVLVALGGNASATGDPDRPPIRCTMPTAYYHAAPEAALGVAMALYARETSGRGRFVDVSMHECQLQSLLSFPGQTALSGKIASRPGPRIGRTREIWHAKDGYITFGLRGGSTRIANLIAMVGYMSEENMAPDWLKTYDWPRYNHNTLTNTEIARLEDAFGAFFRTKTRRELYQQALERRILLAPCNDAREILQHPQLRSRALFVTIEYPHLGASIEHPRSFARSSIRDLSLHRRAPMIGEHNREVFDELGVSETELEQLAREGIV
jgi:crotonobetainyl-CoA:carnitine CoA-transferase CaiB-like acyl-CoA transferase